MNRIFNAKTVAPPTGYSHGSEIPPNSRVVHLAGQLGVSPDGTLVNGIREQTELVWTNIRNVLAEVGMELTDIIKMTHYLLRKEDFAGYREVRSKFLGDHQPPGTLLFIAGLGREGALVEVEVIAAKSAS
jgi:enamine deaminase RidA (YjgF/YER057c/UK114 family)